MLRFKPHQLIYRAGAQVEHIYTIYSGWAACAVTFPDGRRQILSFLLPGDPLPFEALLADDLPLQFSVRALNDLTVCAFKAADLRNIVASNETQLRHLRRSMLRLMGLMNRRLADLGQRRAIGRIAQLILELEGRLRERGMIESDSFEFPPRQDDLSAALGLTPAHVNRTLVALRRRRVIELAQGRLSILDRSALQHTAAEE